MNSADKILWGLIIICAVIVSGLFFYLLQTTGTFSPVVNSVVTQGKNGDSAIVARFDYLSKNGNSSCSSSYRDSIASMPENARLQGSCCSAMGLHLYTEQVKGLEKYKEFSEIPPDPYDIEAGLAKKLVGYYDTIQLSAEEQKEYDYAMQNSKEKGPCCCKCWRWNVYGGLGKYFIKNHGFTGQQVTEVWNLSDGCGGDSDHSH